METEVVLFTCRGCLQLSSSFSEIFLKDNESTNIIMKMLSALSLEIVEDNKLPNVLCSMCFTSLETGYNFVQTYKRSQEVLEQYFSSTPEPIMVNNNSESSVEMADKSSPEISEIQDMVCVEDEKESDLEDTDLDVLIIESIKRTKEFRVARNQLGTDKLTDNDESDLEETPDINETAQTQGNQKSNRNIPLQCPLCSNNYRKYNCFAAHLKQHNEIIPCKFCNLFFDDVDVFLQHHRVKHKYQCQICKEFLPRCDAFTRHMKMHNNTLFRFKCPIETCSKVYCTKSYLKSHLTSVHSDNRNFLCYLCGASFKNYDNLRYHMKKHQGPSHLCPFCGKRFMQSGHLKHHMWRHTGKKPFKCSVCEKAFVTKRILRLHVDKEVCSKSKTRRLVNRDPIHTD